MTLETWTAQVGKESAFSGSRSTAEAPNGRALADAAARARPAPAASRAAAEASARPFGSGAARERWEEEAAEDEEQRGEAGKRGGVERSRREEEGQSVATTVEAIVGRRRRRRTESERSYPKLSALKRLVTRHGSLAEAPKQVQKVYRPDLKLTLEIN